MTVDHSPVSSVKYIKNNKLKSIFVAVCLASAGTGLASGFQLWEQDASGIGDYHAGYATPDSAAAVFYNPAGLSDLDKAQFTGGATVIQLNLPFRGTVSVSSPAAEGAPIPSNAQGGSTNLVPNAYFSMPVNDKFALGIGAATPFGLKTDYGELENTRYVATNTSLRTVDLMPAASYRFNKWFSLGAALDAEYAWADFDQYAGLATDSTTIINGTRSLNSGNSWGWGYHFGFLFNVSEQTKFGFAYHSKIRQKLTGSSTFDGPLANAPDGSQKIVGNDLYATFYTPAYASITLTHQVDPKWKLLGTVDYTQWSSFKDLVLNNVVIIQGLKTQVAIHEGYRNTWNVALGAHYKQNEQMLWKFGVGFDETPTNNTDRNLQLPGQNRIAVALGVRAQLNPKIYMDAGYTHLFQMRATLNSTQSVGPEIVRETTVTRGSVNGGADVIGLQLTANLG